MTTPESSQSTLIARVAVGIAQGAALCLLAYAASMNAWPATNPYAFAPLMTVVVFVPLVVVLGLAELPLRTLAIWATAAAVVCAGLAAYDIFRDPSSGSNWPDWSYGPRRDPDVVVWLALAGGLFVANALVTAGASDRRYIASYPTYFEVSWRQGVQIALASLFAGAFWFVLWLGGELFRLIGIKFLANLVAQDAFAFPAMAVVFAYAIHVADARAGIVQGARTLTLVLLSWLLPVMTLFAVAFLLALPFTGLEALWSTRSATAILLAAVATLVFLINATYQDGRREPPPAAVLRYASVAATLVLAPLVGLAAYGLALRVQQYGWTPERVKAFACVAIAACYAIGYAVAALRWRERLADIETVNVVAAFTTLAVLILLLTPFADPARISVADQLSRLKNGTTPPEKLDVDFLRFRAGRYGMAALDELAAQDKESASDSVGARARLALRAKNAYELYAPEPAATPQSRAANITVQPAGQTLPERFLTQDWNSAPDQWQLPGCLKRVNAKCDAIIADLDDDGSPEIVLFGSEARSAFRATDTGAWDYLGPVLNWQCPGVTDAVHAGEFRMVVAPLKEIEVGEYRLRINPICRASRRTRCEVSGGCPFGPP